MNVTLLDGPTDAEETICTAARNDYMTDYVGHMDFDEVMEPVPGDSLEAKMHHLIEDTLLKHGHFGPFEHPQFTFAVEGVSRVLMAQLTRHRHASFDVQSLRYTSPDVDEIRAIDDHVTDTGEVPDEMKEFVVIPPTIEGSSLESHYLYAQLETFLDYAATLDTLTDQGTPRKNAKEDARFLLPMGTKVNIVFSVNARMLLHIADMRAAGDAQWEIREMTERVMDYADGLLPITMNYYREEMKGRKNRLAP